MSDERYAIARKVLKGIGIVVAAAVLAMSGLSAFFFIAGRDIDPPDVSDLMPSPLPPLEQSENMVPVLMDATNLLVMTRSDNRLAVRYLDPKWNRELTLDGVSCSLSEAEATALVDKLLATNAALFAALDVAAARLRARYPKELESTLPIREIFGTYQYNVLWSFSFQVANYGSLVALRARRLRERGRSPEAVDELLRYGDMLARFYYENESGVVELVWHVGCVINELREAAVYDDLDDEKCAAIDAALTRWAKLREEARRRGEMFHVWRLSNLLSLDRGELYGRYFPSGFLMPKWEYREFGWLTDLAKGVECFIRNYPGYERYAFQPNRTLADVAAATRKSCNQVFDLPYSPETRTRLAAEESAHEELSQFHPFSRNSVGKYCFFEHGRMWRGVGARAFDDAASRLAVAIARYRRKHGAEPAGLEELVPEFLDEVPRDPFDSTRHIGYRADLEILYTVGPEGYVYDQILESAARHDGMQGDWLQQLMCMRRIDGRFL